MTFLPDTSLLLRFVNDHPTAEVVRELPLSVAAGGLQFHQSWWVKSELAVQTTGTFPMEFQAGERLRGAARDVPRRTIAGRGALDQSNVR